MYLEPTPRRHLLSEKVEALVVFLIACAVPPSSAHYAIQIGAGITVQCHARHSVQTLLWAVKTIYTCSTGPVTYQEK